MKNLALSILFTVGIFALGNIAVSAQMMGSGNPMVGGAASSLMRVMPFG